MTLPTRHRSAGPGAESSVRSLSVRARSWASANGRRRSASPRSRAAERRAGRPPGARSDRVAPNRAAVRASPYFGLVSMGRLRLAVVSLLGRARPGGRRVAYSWPFRPFDRQHPIRGFFGDPRTVYENGILAGAFDGPGFFSFHQGVDISAPDGTPIYAVENGTAHYVGAATLNVVTDHDVVFQYFHIVTVVGEGQQVIARKTILGYVQPPFGHVHLTEIDGGKVVNPLQPGHLTPYRDLTEPVIRDIVIRNQTGDVQTPARPVRPHRDRRRRVRHAARRGAGEVRGAPGRAVARAAGPSRASRNGGRRRGGPAADFRTTLPPNARFWDTYAKGTYQNAPRFGHEQYTSMPGRFLFQLAGSYDTTSLANGVYIVDGARRRRPRPQDGRDGSASRCSTHGTACARLPARPARHGAAAGRAAAGLHSPPAPRP